jgi:hypothetical protein
MIPLQAVDVNLVLSADNTCLYATERKEAAFSENSNEAWTQ